MSRMSMFDCDSVCVNRGTNQQQLLWCESVRECVHASSITSGKRPNLKAHWMVSVLVVRQKRYGDLLANTCSHFTCYNLSSWQQLASWTYTHTHTVKASKMHTTAVPGGSWSRVSQTVDCCLIRQHLQTTFNTGVFVCATHAQQFCNEAVGTISTRSPQRPLR